MVRTFLIIATAAVLATGFAVSAQETEAPPQEPAPVEESDSTGAADEASEAAQEAPSADGSPESEETAPPTLGVAPAVTQGSIATAAPASRAESGRARIVITDGNLREVGSDGLLTVGGGVSGTTPPPAASSGSATEGPSVVDRLGEQEQRLRALEANLRMMDEALADPSNRDPYRLPASSAHNRAPGVRDEAEISREQLVAEIEQARAELERLRREALEQGLIEESADEPAGDTP